MKMAGGAPPLPYKLGKPDYVDVAARLIRGNHSARVGYFACGTAGLANSLLFADGAAPSE
jgi:hypothetical protein